MKQPWNTLSKMISGGEIVVERIRITGKNIALEGEFELPLLSRLTQGDGKAFWCELPDYQRTA